MSTNPFAFAALALDAAFADRERELAELVRDMRNGQDVVLVAPRRYGKSSLVLRAVEEVVAGGVLVAYCDLMRTPTKERFAATLAKAIVDDLDFLSVHLYPQGDKVNEAIATLKGFAVDKPVVIEETFPLRCSPKELAEFIDASQQHAAGCIGFYWGKPPEELRRSQQLGDALLLQWLELFVPRAATRTP